MRGDDGQVRTHGGRVFGITALGPTLAAATQRAYALADRVRFASKYLRRDIGAKQLQRDAVR